MSPNEREKPYVLGLDLGVQSIGWAILDMDEDDEPCSVRSTGVRCFDSGVGSEKEIEMGKDESGNLKRRETRQHRRQLWRRSRRQAKLFRMLQRHGLFPEGPAGTPADRHALLVKLDGELAEDHKINDDRIQAHLLPYLLRRKALDQKLDLHAFGRAIYHLGQRRGFLSNRKARKDEKEEGVVKEGIAHLEQEMAEAKARTLGEFLAGIDPEEHRIRSRWTGRNMYLHEFEQMWAAQAARHDSLTDKMKQDIHEAIFHQRPLKSQKHLIGKCQFEPSQRRAPMASVLAQRFRYLQRINDLEIIAPDGEILQPDAEQRELLLAALDAQAEMTFAGMRRVLKLTKPKGYTFNFETNGEKKLVGNRTAAKLGKALDGNWDNLSDQDREDLVDDLLEYENRDALILRMGDRYGIPAEAAGVAAEVSLEAGYCSLSLAALRKLLPPMEAGQHYATASKQIYGQRDDEEALSALPPVLEAVDSLRNPVVCRALSELRKVVNALIRKYGKPHTVRIELARDMKRSRRAREEVSKRMRQNEKAREEAKKILAEMGNDSPSRTDVLKILLADECNWECPYTGKQITPQSLLGESPQFDIEHILPFSRSLDNSYTNKTLCYHQENRDVKGNQTPREAYEGNDDKWREIIARVHRFRGIMSVAKLKRFQRKEIPDDFVLRQLNDTRYMSRLAAEYMSLLFSGTTGKRSDDQGKLRVQVSSGSATAYLRDQWGMNSILGDGPRKDRSDHRHHAIDAVAIAMTDPKTVKQLTRWAIEAERLGRRLFVQGEEPWDGFLDEVRASIEEVKISYRVNRRISGALHQETLYSKEHMHDNGSGKKTGYRHVRKPLQNMSAGEIDNIVDTHIRQLVQEKLKAGGGNPKKVFADINNHPYLRTRDGSRIIPIHKARFRKTVATIAIGKGNGRRYVAPGSNHHMEIFATTDVRGNKKWQGEIVSMYDAAQRLRQGLPVVDTEREGFQFSLSGGEDVEMEHEAGEPRLYRVVGISVGRVEFRTHTDARSGTELKKTKGARVFRSPGKLLTAKARKVAIDPIGNALPAND